MRSADFSATLARGLEVIKAFTERQANLTVSEIAEATGMSRAAARRFLLTLIDIGYVGMENQRFFLMPKVLELGYAYLSQYSISDIAQPYMRQVVAKLNESATLGVLDWPSVVYIAREQAQRHILATAMGVGSRIPASHSVIGRVILAYLPRDRVDAYLEANPLYQFNEKSITDTGRFHEILAEVRQNGWSLVDEEWERGLIAVGVPVFDRQGKVVAALSTGAPTSRATTEDLMRHALPAIRDAAEQISRMLTLSSTQVSTGG